MLAERERERRLKFLDVGELGIVLEYFAEILNSFCNEECVRV